jgi:YjbR
VTLLERVRKLCLALPEAFEIEAWEHPTFRVGGGRGKMFCIAAEDGSSVRVKADPIEREALLEQGDPFYMPAYVGTKGWVGVQLDDRTDWVEVADRDQLLPDRLEADRGRRDRAPLARFLNLPSS